MEDTFYASYENARFTPGGYLEVSRSFIGKTTSAFLDVNGTVFDVSLLREHISYVDNAYGMYRYHPKAISLCKVL